MGRVDPRQGTHDEDTAGAEDVDAGIASGDGEDVPVGGAEAVEGVGEGGEAGDPVDEGEEVVVVDGREADRRGWEEPRTAYRDGHKMADPGGAYGVGHAAASDAGGEA